MLPLRSQGYSCICGNTYFALPQLNLFVYSWLYSFVFKIYSCIRGNVFCTFLTEFIVD